VLHDSLPSRAGDLRRRPHPCRHRPHLGSKQIHASLDVGSKQNQGLGDISTVSTLPFNSSATDEQLVRRSSVTTCDVMTDGPICTCHRNGLPVK
jgi:hypothetical protein